MSADGNRIVCRKCGESISLDNSNCPNCGTSIRSPIPYAIAIAFGVVLIGAAAMNLDDLLAYGVVGLIVVVTGGYFIYERRQRIAEASAETQTFEG